MAEETVIAGEDAAEIGIVVAGWARTGTARSSGPERALRARSGVAVAAVDAPSRQRMSDHRFRKYRDRHFFAGDLIQHLSWNGDGGGYLPTYPKV
jgi:hypothetical protein